MESKPGSPNLNNISLDRVDLSLVLPKGNPIFAPRFTDYR